MNSKSLSHIKKVVIASAIIILCSANSAYAFSIGGRNVSFGNNMRNNFLGRFLNTNKDEKEEYTLEEVKKELTTMKQSENIDFDKITELTEKLPEGSDKAELTGITDMFSKVFEGIEEVDLTAVLEPLIDTLLNTIESLLGSSGDLGFDFGSLGDLGNIGSIIGGIGGSSSSSSLPVEVRPIDIQPHTANEFLVNSGKIKEDELDEYVQNLHASIYMHVDENGNEDSDKWALVIHPFLYTGEKIADIIGPFYYENGYNIIAPDLRGFGESAREGAGMTDDVSLGCLDSMDMYDWLIWLNEQSGYNVSQIIVHGISLGGATTNFLSGIDGFLRDGDTPMSDIKSIRELNVIGLVNDCGFANMEQFASKSELTSTYKTGLTDENFAYYSNALESLEHCELPMLIIHGTSDSTVDFEQNAIPIQETLEEKGNEVYTYYVEGGSHAFIIMGNNEDDYRNEVDKFIDICE